MEQSPAWTDPLWDWYHAREPRARAVAATLLIEAAIILGVIYGLAGPVALLPTRSTSLVSIALDPPPQPKERLKASGSTENGRAAPPSLKAEAAPVVAPLRTIVPPHAPPAAITPAASLGVKAGAATKPGAGSGAGGLGTGSGSGTGGNGTGDGNGDGNGGGSDPEWTGGKIRNKDYPKAVREAHISGTTVTEISVSSGGQPAGCRVTRSSGSRELDTTTCQLVMERFHFKPARNAAGQAVASQIEYEQEWDAPPPPPPDSKGN